MPRCDANAYLLEVKASNGLQGVVDHEDHKGDEGKALLEILLSKRCEMRTVMLSDVYSKNGIMRGDAHWISPRQGLPNGGFYFYGYLANTGDVADKFNVEPSDIVKAIDKNLLYGVRSHSGHFRMVVKDKLYDSITREQLLDNRSSGSVKIKGRGLTSKILRTIERGIIPSSGFCSEDVVEGLKKVGWEQNRDYARTSIPSAMRALEYNKNIVVVRDGHFSIKLWSHANKAPPKITSEVTPSIAEKVLPSVKTLGNIMDDMVEELSDEMAARVKTRTKEKLGL